MTTEDLRKPLARRQLIRRLIATGEIHSQEQVVAELARRGITVTQATVSRDFAESLRESDRAQEVRVRVHEAGTGPFADDEGKLKRVYLRTGGGTGTGTDKGTGV